MTIIYEPAGRAKEYCELAANLYRGCDHKCVYCYAPLATRSNKERFHLDPQPRIGVIDKLKKDASKIGGAEKRPVMLSFTSDPYQHLDAQEQLTRQAIKALKANLLKVVILTKGGTRAERDFDLLDGRDFVGATLTFISNKDSLEWEPGAALPHERMQMLMRAKERGIQTWASLEPVIDPEQSLEIIRQTHPFVDLYKVGTLNHHSRAKEIDWAKFARDVVKLLQELNCKYYIKDDLRKYLTKTA